MAWQRPSCIVQAVQSVRHTAQLQSLRPSALPPIATPFLLRAQQTVRRYATEIPPEGPEPEAQAQMAGLSNIPPPSSPTTHPATPDAASTAPEIDFSNFLKRPARIVPRSPSYFSTSPKFYDHLLKLEDLVDQNSTIPTLPATEAPRKAWLTITQFREKLNERVPSKRFAGFVKVLNRLNQIDPLLIPPWVEGTLQEYIRPGNPYSEKPAPPTVDEMGISRGRGKRKEASALVRLVEGEGEVLVNGKTLGDVFPRIHDRESALWPLRCTNRLDKYNVFARVKGGGTTGQAEAITLALARALLVHEPGLKTAMRKAGTIIVDARRVERKKPGHLKARKMPTWVKR